MLTWCTHVVHLYPSGTCSAFVGCCADGDCLGGETCSCAQSCYLEGNCCSDIVTSAGCLPSKCVIIVLVVTVWVERLVPVHAQSCYLEGNCCSDIITAAGCLPSKCILYVLCRVKS